MLTEAESKGLKTILYSINDYDLFSLLETVTKRMFTTKLRDEAIERILSCTSKPLDLLRRQKVTKKIIFNYLLKVGVPIIADLEKSKLVDKCLKFWCSDESCEENDLYEMEITESPSQAVIQMGVEFSKWLFPKLNSLDGFGPEHFWPECSLQAQLETPVEVKEVTLSGANNVVTFLTNLIIFDKFYFHANDSGESIVTEEDPHGLIKIIIKGVLHQHSNCVGLFDSAFGLIKNPLYQNTYKIQLVKLRMQANMSPQNVLPCNYYFPICQATTT